MCFLTVGLRSDAAHQIPTGSCKSLPIKMFKASPGLQLSLFSVTDSVVAAPVTCYRFGASQGILIFIIYNKVILSIGKQMIWIFSLDVAFLWNLYINSVGQESE